MGDAKRRRAMDGGLVGRIFPELARVNTRSPTLLEGLEVIACDRATPIQVTDVATGKQTTNGVDAKFTVVRQCTQCRGDGDCEACAFGKTEHDVQATTTNRGRTWVVYSRDWER